MFAVKSYKLSRLHLLLISGGDELPWLMRCLFSSYTPRVTDLVLLENHCSTVKSMRI